ncbi:hypothetical protein PR202_ga11948 [Eleusine coracana subsp. coracana]|uniref:R13L1/DRL21-like LRR repeat region domain-containing protein n=1 Tax=Eleusine coracana subsp. coracana TaxID=191504 RepID=A0AAV5CAU9_ELECO|nr:hypothetical protein PR202_ga11948 [Eleusine coracana subsp. coracana]
MLPESFCQLKVLKELDLSDCQDLKELPECFGKLSELHSLNLTSCSKLQLLPESFCNLSKLKHLNLSCCASLEKLDSSLGNLKLQTLDLSGCLTLALLPDNVRKMTSLTRLLANAADSAVTGNSYTPSSLRLPFPGRRLHYVGQSGTLELGTLTSCTDLDIGQLQCLEHPEDAERAKLRDRTDLRGLALHWSHGMVSTEKVKFKEMDAKTMDLHSRLVLERLIPPRTLENMELFGYMSKDFPGWMFDISTYLPCLGCIELYDLKHCDSLPPFGQLPNLRILDMTSMPSIKKVGQPVEGLEVRNRVIEHSPLKEKESYCAATMF